MSKTNTSAKVPSARRRRVLLVFLVAFASKSRTALAFVRTAMAPSIAPMSRGPSTVSFRSSIAPRRSFLASALIHDDQQQQHRQQPRLQQREQHHLHQRCVTARPSRIRRFVSKIVRRQGDADDVEIAYPISTDSLRIASVSDEEMFQGIMRDMANDFDYLGGSGLADDAFISQNFEDLSPSMVFQDVTTLPGCAGDDSQLFDVSLTQEDVMAGVSTSSPNFAASLYSATAAMLRRATLSSVVSLLVRNALVGIIVRNSVETPEQLEVSAEPLSTIAVLRGMLSTDASIKVNRLVFPCIQMSGGTLHVKRLTLNLLAFYPWLMKVRARFPKQFDLHADNWIFSGNDLQNSGCIREGLRMLLVRILKDRGVKESTLQVTKIDILPSGKVSINGEAKTRMGTSLVFEVRTGIATSSRGHVLTFPGLEISLNRDIGLFVPIMTTLDLDVGHNARFSRIHIDGKKKQIQIDASITITPAQTIRLSDYEQSSKSFKARFNTDVGLWLTQLGNFSQ